MMMMSDLKINEIKCWVRRNDWKELDVVQFQVQCSYFLEGLRRTMKNSSWNNSHSGQHSSQWLSKYELQLSVGFWLFCPVYTIMIKEFWPYLHQLSRYSTW